MKKIFKFCLIMDTEKDLIAAEILIEKGWKDK